VLIAGAWEGPEGPFSATGALQEIADAGVLDSGVDFKSAAWGPGDIAMLVATLVEYDEYQIDGVGWSGTDPMELYFVEDIVLATSTWELTGEGWSSPGGWGSSRPLCRWAVSGSPGAGGRGTFPRPWYRSTSRCACGSGRS
jgi:hypothetical protein